jgi:hypothetical protein
MAIRSGLLLFVLLGSAAAGSNPPNYCQPSPEIATELQKASAAPVRELAAFDENVAPFLALRKQYPDDLFVNEAYQDAVQRHGVEGYLRALTQEYQVLAIQHPDSVISRYLSVRSIVGRSTMSAIQQLTEIIADNPDFAPAHRELAEIYGSETFHNAEKEKAQRERFQQLCPGAKLDSLPHPLPAKSPLLDQAEHQLAVNGDPVKVMAMADQSVRDDEWRLQRIRPFDWYSADFKRQAQHELQASYWRLWNLQVRCLRKSGDTGKVAQLLEEMDQRAALLHKDSDPNYWPAITTLIRLYAEGNQQDRALEKVKQLQQFLQAHPDTQHSTELKELDDQLHKNN